MVVDVVVVVFLFRFRFRLHDAGLFPGVRNFGRTKITGGFFTSSLLCGERLFIASSGFSFGDFHLALIQNKKNSGRDRDKFSTVFYSRKNPLKTDSVSVCNRSRVFTNSNSLKLRIYSSTIGDLH